MPLVLPRLSTGTVEGRLCKVSVRVKFNVNAMYTRGRGGGRGGGRGVGGRRGAAWLVIGEKWARTDECVDFVCCFLPNEATDCNR